MKRAREPWIQNRQSGSTEVLALAKVCGHLGKCLEPMRKMQAEGQVKFEAKALHFATGQDLLDWVRDTKTTLQPNEVKQ